MRGLILRLIVGCALIFGAGEAFNSSVRSVGQVHGIKSAHAGIVNLLGAGTGTTTVASSSTTTFDPANKSANITLSGGNLIATSSTTSFSGVEVRSIASFTTKKYFEVTVTNDGGSVGQIRVGLVNSSFVIDSSTLGQSGNDAVGYLAANGEVRINGSAVATLANYLQTNVIGVATDAAGALVWFRVNNGNWNNNVLNSPVTGVGGISIAALGAVPLYAAIDDSINTGVLTANFGATAYANAAPSGYGNL